MPSKHAKQIQMGEEFGHYDGGHSGSEVLNRTLSQLAARGGWKAPALQETRETIHLQFFKGEHPLKPMPGHYLTARIDEVCEEVCD